MSNSFVSNSAQTRFPVGCSVGRLLKQEKGIHSSMTPCEQHLADQAHQEIDPAEGLLDDLSRAIDGERKENHPLRSNCRDDCREQLKPLP
jgi:hypothetical protein